MAPWVQSAKKSCQNGNRPETTTLASNATNTEPRAYRLRNRFGCADGMVVAEFGGKRKRGLKAKRAQQPRDDAGQAPLRHGDAIGHEHADQQHRQVEQRELRCARDPERHRLAKLTDRPSARECLARRAAQKRKQARRIDRQKIDRDQYLRRDIGDGDGQAGFRSRRSRPVGATCPTSRAPSSAATRRDHRARARDKGRPPGRTAASAACPPS